MGCGGSFDLSVSFLFDERLDEAVARRARAIEVRTYVDRRTDDRGGYESRGIDLLPTYTKPPVGETLAIMQICWDS